MMTSLPHAMSDRPNLLFIFPDQLRPDFLGCHGGRAVATPHIDALAAEGMRYEDAVSGCPVCVPARASLLTGLTPFGTGVLGNGTWLRPDRAALGIETWPEILRRAGYHTAAIGKMHFYPWDSMEGFEERVIAEDKRHIQIEDDYAAFLREHGERKYHGTEHEGYCENKGAIFSRLPRELTVDRFVGREACKFIRDHDESRPFALMVGLPSPHCPYDPVPESLTDVDRGALPEPIPCSTTAPFPSEHREKFLQNHRNPWHQLDYTTFTRDEKLRIRAHYAALVKQIDDEVGAMVGALKERGLWDKTVVIFASDHGDLLGDHDLIGKSNFYESACRIPLIVRGPGINAGVHAGPVELLDVTATLLRLAGLEPPRQWDSIALPELGLSEPRRREEQLGLLTGSCMIRHDGWKLVRYDDGSAFLFNHANDPGEQHNLLDTEEGRERFRQLDARLSSWLLRGIQFSARSQRVTNRANGFGSRGWQRVYPASVID